MDPMKPASQERVRVVQDFFTKDRQRWSREYSATDYDSRRYQLRATETLRMLEQRRGDNPGRLLDVGTGAGLQAGAAHALGYQVVGMDLTPAMIEGATAVDGPVWLVGAAEALPFAADSFDVVMMLGLIGYVSEPQGALERVKECLQPGGLLVVSFHNRETLFSLLSRAISYIPRKLWRLLRPTSRTKQGSTRDFYSDENRDWRRHEFRDMLQAAGYQPLEHVAVDFGRFRPFGVRIWPSTVDKWLSGIVEWVANRTPLTAIQAGGFTHVVLATPMSE